MPHSKTDVFFTITLALAFVTLAAVALVFMSGCSGAVDPGGAVGADAGAPPAPDGGYHADPCDYLEHGPINSAQWQFAVDHPECWGGE